ncbi:MAG: hypothetical protein ACO3F2_06170 [Roseiflexaceae bacterium]
MESLFYGAFAVINVVITINLIRLAIQQKSLGLGFAAMAGFGLAYDNAIIGSGSLIGAGDTLMQLNIGRYLIHAITTPLLILTGLVLARNASIGWSWRRSIAVITGVTVIGFIAYDSNTYLSNGYVLAPEGMLRYVLNVDHNGPPLAPITTMSFMIAFGIGLYIQERSWWLLAGALAMFMAAAMQLGIFANIGEILLMVSVLLTARAFPKLSHAGYQAAIAAVPAEERNQLAEAQRGRKRKMAIGNRTLAWVIFFSLAIDTVAYYQEALGLQIDSWVHLTFSNIYIMLFFIHAVASLYFYGIPKLRSHIRVVHVYIGYGVFVFTMVSQSLIGMEPIHMITYLINWGFIIAHIVLSIRFMLQRVRRQQLDPMLELTVSPHLRETKA